MRAAISRAFGATITRAAEDWTKWQIRVSETPAGIGEKTYPIFRDSAEAAITGYLDNNPEYYTNWQSAVAQMIRRACIERYGLDAAKRRFRQYALNLTNADRETLEAALDHLEKGQALLDTLA